MKQVIMWLVVVGTAVLVATASPSSDFVRKARHVYATAEYSTYTNTVVTEFIGKASDFYDQPKGEELVDWVAVEGVRNVRDLGGWNGLRRGRVYRGSELNAVTNHGLKITSVGLDVMRHKVCIASDLDLRAVNPKERAEYVTVSPLGADVRLLNHPIGNYMTMFTQTNQYAATLREFTKAENYPIYMHCWGGADRTGTVAFILEGLCGVSEVDLAIDYELTSFSLFGKRLRCGSPNGHFNYPGIIKRIKEYPGATLADQFAAYAQQTLGLSAKEVAAIRANLQVQK